ncbi:MAG: hypothetical protein CAPSK01_003858 [Candidatus Accumulibacter vicinus]|uniref:Uncharacterized protein n=1 Tax=Candidatus Accumulibacter vicinus TaxID=2954382 RepID=A0A084XWS5_9PROT|nr:MAG: hypothetical protein CAPSK01_003858 [Candidatus Accumulibacter vicinus]
MANPVLILEIPLYGLADTGVEGFRRFPAQFPLDLAGVDGVAAIVAGPVGDIADLFVVGLAVGTWSKLVEQRADRVYDVEIGFFVPAADIVGLAGTTGFKDAPDGTAVVLDVEPVANLLAVAIDGQGLAGEGIDDDQWDQLLGEVVGAVVVRAVGGEHWQAIGVMVGAHQVVACCLACRVGTVGLVAMGFTESRFVSGQRAIDFVGGDLQEAEALSGLVG